MKQIIRTLIASLVDHYYGHFSDQKTYQVTAVPLQEKRQIITPTFRIGANGETILVINGQDIVFLTGNNARCNQIQDDQFVIYSAFTLIVFPSSLETFFDIERYWFLDENPADLILTMTPEGIDNTGPGTLYTSIGAAFFTKDMRVSNIIADIKAAAMPIQTLVNVRRETGDPIVSVLDVDNGNFTMRLTGSPSAILDIPTDNRILYRGNTLTVQQGLLDTVEYPNIQMFAVIQQERGTNTTRYRVLFTESPEVIRGPGQVYIGVDENRAFFVEDLLFRGGDTDIIGFINQQIFIQAFTLQPTDSTVNVLDSAPNLLITLTRNTSKFSAPNAMEVTYIAPEQLLVLRDRGGRTNSFPGIDLFSIFENNTLKSFNSMTGSSMYFLCTGGTVFIDGSQALFASVSNPFVISELCNNIPFPEGILYTYDIVVDSEFKRILRSITRNITDPFTTAEEQTPLQVVTGVYIANVREPEAVAFRNNTVLIRDFFDNTVTRIEGVDTLFVNTQSEQFRQYDNQAPIPFHGPGTLSYSRGTAFFTTNRSLSRDLRFEARTAGVPDIDVELITATVNDIDGENFTESVVALKIGGDRVVTFEASSYRTSTDQEVLYADDLVTVHRPILTREGNVTYTGSTQTVGYTDAEGNTRVIMGVSTFQDYSGGEVRTSTPSDNISVRGPGKIYVSEDGTSVLFSSSSLITCQVAEIIRRGPTDFSTEADQFSSIYAGVFNLSTNSATVTYPGGGVIYYSTFGGRRESLYLDNTRITNRLRQEVSSFIPLTKSVALERQGIIRFIYNGHSVYMYRPIAGNNEILIPSTEFIVFNDTNITTLRFGPISGIRNLILFDGIELATFNESSSPLELGGTGLLLVMMDSDTAFYITHPFSVISFLQTTKNLRAFLIPPKIRVSSTEVTVTTKKLTDDFKIGTNVRAFAGASITFTCAARGRPSPTLEFFRVIEGGARLTLNDSQAGISIGENSVTLGSIGNADSGTYGCRADNTIPPAAEALSTLAIIEAVAPRLRPGWFPFILLENQSIFWPTDPPSSTTFEVQVVRQLVFACRVGGRPRSNVTWMFNNVGIPEASTIGLLDNTSVSIISFSNGRSALIIDVRANRDILRGQNQIVCSAENAGGSTAGRITLVGTYYNCSRVGEGECSRTCGLGYRPIMYACIVTQGELPDETIPASRVPGEGLPMGRIEVCEGTDDFGQYVICPLTEFRWNTSEWTECSKTCGGGSQIRNVSCLNISIPVTSQYIANPEMAIETETDTAMCAMCEKAGVRPTSRELCNIEDCPIWVAEEEFTECSVTCGVGVRTREVTCNIITGIYTDQYGDIQFNLTLVNSSLCDPEKQPLPSKQCRPFRCQYDWRPLEFGGCGDVPLANEFPHCRQRGFFCYNGDPSLKIPDSERVLNDSLCADVKPRDSPLGSCGGGRCFNGIWKSSPPTPCSATCGCGVRTRTVECLSPISLTLVENHFCDIGTRPPLREKCLIRNCENRCEGDEVNYCSIYETLDMCDHPVAMGNNGLRCCVTCLGLLSEDEEAC